MLLTMFLLAVFLALALWNAKPIAARTGSTCSDKGSERYPDTPASHVNPWASLSMMEMGAGYLGTCLP